MAQPCDDLTGRVALVVGGSGGIGAATARQLARAGARIVIGYHQGRTAATALLSELPGTGHRAMLVAIDDSASIRRLADEIADAYGRLDILVNAAGMTRAIPHDDLDALDDATIDRVFAVNLRGPLATIRALKPLLQATGDAVVVNISSTSAFTGRGSNIAYAAAKAGLDTLTRSLARALAPAIRVVGVSPGSVETDFVPGRDREALQRQARASPLQRVIEPDDVARAVLACVTHLKAATGIRIVVDGGSHL
ncbi:3-oxoacyl-ACP reductase [Hypericibacter terrae]|uniref:3-oxoacyl-ACP reductase n=1 Tax=Hypericibacter terrae TaxID=2602015 RepID=A0A5J6MH03_9PROT|nr:SDR family oxidoreductase [Hypericibacter terrae]QEX15775.1 3-oxoacyl-ACP reductase [Hypericibacter terrae]